MFSPEPLARPDDNFEPFKARLLCGDNDAWAYLKEQYGRSK